MIGGMFSPYNIIEKEVNKYKLYHKHTLMKYGCESLLFLHICSKIVSSFFINVITTLGLLFSLGLIYDIRNYITLFVVLLFGMFYISVIGYFIAVIGIALNLKRELVSFIHIIIVVFFTQIKNVSFLFPFSVVRSELNGIINSDLVFSQVYNIELSKIGYFIISLIISLILSYVFLLTLGITSRYKKIKGEHYKHAINFE